MCILVNKCSHIYIYIYIYLPNDSNRIRVRDPDIRDRSLMAFKSPQTLPITNG